MNKLETCQKHDVKWNLETTDKCPECASENEDHKDKVLFARSGYYKSLVARKEVENNNLSEQRKWLMEQVYFLRKSVAFLESRKRELEDGVKSLEKIINIGVTVVEKIEDSERLETEVALLENERDQSKDVKKTNS